MPEFKFNLQSIYKDDPDNPWDCKTVQKANLGEAKEFADLFNRDCGGMIVISITDVESGEVYEMYNLYRFSWKLRMGTHTNGTLDKLLEWAYCDGRAAYELAIAKATEINIELNKRFPRTWHPWIYRINSNRDDSEYYPAVEWDHSFMQEYKFHYRTKNGTRAVPEQYGFEHVYHAPDMEYAVTIAKAINVPWRPIFVQTVYEEESRHSTWIMSEPSYRQTPYIETKPSNRF